jgi:hypothetical protein
MCFNVNTTFAMLCPYGYLTPKTEKVCRFTTGNTYLVNMLNVHNTIPELPVQEIPAAQRVDATLVSDSDNEDSGAELAMTLYEHVSMRRAEAMWEESSDNENEDPNVGLAMTVYHMDISE